MRTFSILVVTLVFSVSLWNSESLGAGRDGSTQTASGVGVTAKVTYLRPGNGDDLRFQIALDSHSVSLDGYDLSTLSVLRNDTGEIYLPIGTENRGSGYHRNVTLIFPMVAKEVKQLELVIKDIIGVKEITFHWDRE